MEECVYCRPVNPTPIVKNRSIEITIDANEYGSDIDIEGAEPYAGWRHEYFEANYCPMCGRYIKKE